jgi:CRISPR/Cas system-associated endoribonuclease Cas2
MTLRLHIEKIAAKALGRYIRTYSIFKSKHLSASIKLIIYRALIRSIMTYACPTWEFAADTHLMKLQRVQNSVFRAISNLDRRTLVRDLQLAFKIPCVYDYITKLCRRQAEVILNYENPNVCAIGQGEVRHRKYKRLKLGGGQVYYRSSV